MPVEAANEFGRSTPRSLVVDGHCRFWVGRRGPNGEVRTGTLSAEEAVTLSRESGFGRWASLGGDHFPRDAATDQGWTVLRDGTGSHRPVCCYASCGAQDGRSEGIPRPLPDAVRALARWTLDLWKRGTPLSGPVRYTLSPIEFDYAAQYTGLPSDVGLVVSPVKPEPVAFGSPDGIDGQTASGAQAAVLRQLRERGKSVPPVRRGRGILLRKGELANSLRVWDTLPPPASEIWGKWSYCGSGPGTDW